MSKMRISKTEYFRRLFGRHMWLAIILCMVLTCMLPGFTVAAAPGDCSVTVSYPWEGISVHLYRIGTMDEKGKFELETRFDGFQVDMTSTDAAATLASYIRREGMKADQDLLTGADGSASFSGLEEGTFLLLADEMKNDQGHILTSPVMVSLPALEEGVLVKDLTVQGKYEIKSDEPASLTVIKNWKNDDEKKRPESITVQLMKDGETVEEEVVLSKEYSWTKTWEKLDGGHVWTVVEKEVPEGYLVSISTNGNKSAIINTGDSDKPHKPGDKLPQTGQTWWLVPLMVSGGLFLILLGLLLRPKQKS